MIGAGGQLTLKEQAGLIEYLVASTSVASGEPASETFMRIDGKVVEDLRQLARRLNRMSPHEGKIARIVMGRR